MTGVKNFVIHYIDKFFFFALSSSKYLDVVPLVQTKAHITVLRSKVVWQLCKRKWNPLTKHEHTLGSCLQNTLNGWN